MQLAFRDGLIRSFSHSLYHTPSSTSLWRSDAAMLIIYAHTIRPFSGYCTSERTNARPSTQSCTHVRKRNVTTTHCINNTTSRIICTYLDTKVSCVYEKPTEKFHSCEHLEFCPILFRSVIDTPTMPTPSFTYLRIERMAKQFDQLLCILFRFARFGCIQNGRFDATR